MVQLFFWTRSRLLQGKGYSLPLFFLLSLIPSEQPVDQLRQGTDLIADREYMAAPSREMGGGFIFWVLCTQFFVKLRVALFDRVAQTNKKARYLHAPRLSHNWTVRVQRIFSHVSHYGRVSNQLTLLIFPCKYRVNSKNFSPAELTAFWEEKETQTYKPHRTSAYQLGLLVCVGDQPMTFFSLFSPFATDMKLRFGPPSS